MSFISFYVRAVVQDSCPNSFQILNLTRFKCEPVTAIQLNRNYRMKNSLLWHHIHIMLRSSYICKMEEATSVFHLMMSLPFN